MGAKDWMLLYAHGEVRPTLQATPDIDRDATRALMGRLYPGRPLRDIDDGNLFEHTNPRRHHVYAGCYPGLTVVCTDDVALDRPSELPPHFRTKAAGHTLYLHAMHSVVDWFACAVWTPDGHLRRALSLSPTPASRRTSANRCRSSGRTGPENNRSTPASPTSRTRCRSTRWRWPRTPYATCSASTAKGTTSTTSPTCSRSPSPGTSSKTGPDPASLTGPASPADERHGVLVKPSARYPGMRRCSDAARRGLAGSW